LELEWEWNGIGMGMEWNWNVNRTVPYRTVLYCTVPLYSLTHSHAHSLT
jgi:hypothetical protein